MKILLPTIFILFLVFSSYAQEAAVISEKASLRSVPSEKARVIKVLSKNAIVTTVRQKGTWTFVKWNRLQGWLRSSTITPVRREMRVGQMTRVGSIDSDTGGRVVSGMTSTGGVGRVDMGSEPPPSPNRGVPGTISGGVLNGKATSLPKPGYPPAAKAIRASGLVTIQVLIDEDGRVISASAVSGHPLLRAAAVSAARSSTFSPTLLEGKPVKVSGVITYNFVP